MSNIPCLLHIWFRRGSGRRLALAGWMLALGASAGSLAAQEPAAADKSQFTLFHPTPVALMREMATDRPDTTESAITVDAGHVQLEMSLVDFARFTDRGMRTDATTIAPFNLKVGLLNRVDLQFVLEPWVIERLRARGAPIESVRGIGDAQVRIKVNLWGNDGPQPGFGPTAFALMPFVKIPTAARALGNGRVEGGLIAPFSAELPGGFELGAMLELDVVRNASNTAYGVECVQTITVSHKLAGELSGYVELVGIAPCRTETTFRSYASGGLTYNVGKNVQFDLGGRLGLSRASDDWNVFAGVSVRH